MVVLFKALVLRWSVMLQKLIYTRVSKKSLTHLQRYKGEDDPRCRYFFSGVEIKPLPIVEGVTLGQ